MKNTACTVALCALIFVSVSLAAQDLWWAVATTGDQSAYGAAWNYPSRTQAEENAIEECEKQQQGKCNYYGVKSYKNSCFVVTRTLWNDGNTRFFPHVSFASRAEARSFSKSIPENYGSSTTVVLEQCAGVD